MFEIFKLYLLRFSRYSIFTLNNLFYTSGSPVYNQEDKFALKNLSLKLPHGKQFLTKYHGYPSSSLLSIPQKYYGEQIKNFVILSRSLLVEKGELTPTFKYIRHQIAENWKKEIDSMYKN